MIQECRWTHSGDWTSTVEGTKFACICSGHKDHRFAGVLIIFRESLIAANTSRPLNCLQWEEALCGRVLHVRCPTATQPIDIVCCYQKHVANNSADESLQTRHATWQALHDVLHRCPKRNLLLIGMDANVPVVTHQPWIGPCCPQAVIKEHHDTEALQQLLQDFSLCALNTWEGQASENYTFIAPQGARSLIDIVLMRLSHADDHVTMKQRKSGPDMIVFS